MARGTAKWFNLQKEYGFIQPKSGGGKDVFVHISAVEKAGLSGLNEGQIVEYDEVPDKGKTSAESFSWASPRTTSSRRFLHGSGRSRAGYRLRPPGASRMLGGKTTPTRAR